MKNSIRDIFEQNMDLIRRTEIALLYYREQRYDKALGLTAQAIERLRDISEAILLDQNYFSIVSKDSVAEMLEGLLEAKKKKDYVLLADLFELQLLGFLYGIQKLILSKEDYMEYDEASYYRRVEQLKNKLTEGILGARISEEEKTGKIDALNRILDTPLDPEKLLQDGYRVEFTASGRMTAVIRDKDFRPVYLHSNANVSREAFLFAKRFAQQETDSFIIYGLGMGYHIEELLYLSPDSRIEIYETDANIIKLFCAFSGTKEILQDRELRLIFDPDGTLIRKRLREKQKNETVCVHYPSLRNVKEEELRELLSGYIPWVKLIENI